MALYKGSTKVSWSAGAGFDPQNTGTVGQVLTKTSTGYNWDDATWSIESSNDTYDNIIYLSQAEYDALVTKDPNTLYSTPDGEAGSFVDDTVFWSNWDWVTDKAPSMNVVYDKVSWLLSSETVSSWDSWVSYIVKVSSSAPASWTTNTVITIVTD